VTAECLAENTVLAFLGGVLPPEDLSSIEEHLAACAACTDLVTWAAADQRSAIGLPGHDGRPFVGHLAPGAHIGRYQILGAIGRGGMGEVYAAYHPDLDRRIAVKVVQRTEGRADQRRERLLREARAIARLSHPNVITVHDAGTFGDGVFIAMELIDGYTIDQWLRAETRTWQEIVDVFIAAARGLAAAHAAGVIHRDFKPQNVMIAKDGAVRVMDFGLARLPQDDPADVGGQGARELPRSFETLTKTGAFVGTPAYMSPEQFRREATDVRSDQYSFCVALHEALYGSRPVGAPAEPPNGADGPPLPARRTGVPSWLRAVLLRGASPERARRYPSMDAVVAALEHGRRRLRRRVSLSAVALMAILISAVTWNVARGNRLACAAPVDRTSAVWAAEAGNPRRASIHRAFDATGRATAQTSWDRLSKALDSYMNAWTGMYLQTCEATHVRGEQSAEVLDLRMSCLNDNLDQVRALTDKLVAADENALSHAVAAAQGLTPVSRCADVSLLRSAVPLPKDEGTLRAVQQLRRTLRQIQTQWDIGDAVGVLRRSNLLRPEVEAIGYKPLLGEVLYLIGISEGELDPDATKSEATLRQAMLVAQAARDDLTAAKVAASLVYVNGYRLGRLKEAEFWAAFGHASLDRLGGDPSRMRAWLDGDLAGARTRGGDFEGARVLAERAVALKEKSLGKDHPDYAASLGDLAYVLVRGGHGAEAVDYANRAVEIFLKHSDPDAFSLGQTYANQGEVLLAVGRYAEAESAFTRALQNLTKNIGRAHSETAYALHGLGEVRLARGAAGDAVGLFEEALSARLQPDIDPTLAAESQFGLARALWDSHGDRTRARTLATTARTTYGNAGRTDKKKAVDAWLADHIARD
jgi:serine/threonine protein kinase/tetratricopeptide (TPR) repeat protein